MTEDANGSTSYAASRPITTAMLACVPLVAVGVFLEIYLSGYSRAGWSSPSTMSRLAGNNVFTVTQNITPFVLGYILGLFTIRDWKSGMRALGITFALLLVFALEWLAIGSLVGSHSAASAISRGWSSMPRLALIELPFAVLGLALGAGSTRLRMRSTEALSEAPKSAPSGFTYDSPYISGCIAVILFSAAAFAVRNIFTPLLLHGGAIAFGALVGRRYVNGWTEVLYELLKILGLLLLIAFSAMVALILMGPYNHNSALGIIALPLALAYASPWIVGGIVFGWKLWK